MFTGIYKFIEGAYLLLGQINGISLETYIITGLILTCIIFGVVVGISIMCAYFYKYLKRILES